MAGDVTGMTGDQSGSVATAPPPAAQPAPSTPTPSPAANDWAKSAQNAETQSADLSGQKIPQQPAQTVPVPITPLKRPGLLGVMDSVADALAGKTRPELGVDPDGNKYIKQQTLTRGQQWMKIAGEAFAGASAGLAAGRGRGNEGKAGMAGVEEGEHLQDRQNQAQQRMQSQVDQDKLAKANNQMLQMKIAEQAWTMANNKTKATQEQIKFNEDQIKQLTDQGGKILGTAAHPGDIADILKVQPDVMEQLVKKGTIQIRKNLDEDGNVTGMTAILMPQDWGKTMLPGGATGHHFNPISGQVEEFHYSDPVSQGEVAANDAAAVAAQNDFLMKKATLAKTTQETATSATEAQKNRGETAEVPSVINKNNAEAAKDRADTAVPGAPGGTGIQDDIAEGLAAGRYLMGKDLPLRTSKDQATAAQYTKAADDYSRAHFGLPYSPELIRQESKMAESPHTQAFLTGIDRMIGSDGVQGQLDQVLALARAAGIGENAPAQELKLWVKQKLGLAAQKNFEQGLSDTQTTLGTLIGNPLLGSGESDLKLKTAQKQFGSNPTLSDLEGAVATTKQILARAKSTLVQNNRYLQQRYGEEQGSGNTQAAQAARVQPGEPTAKAADGSLLVVRNGQWVPAQP